MLIPQLPAGPVGRCGCPGLTARRGWLGWAGLCQGGGCRPAAHTVPWSAM